MAYSPIIEKFEIKNYEITKLNSLNDRTIITFAVKTYWHTIRSSPDI